jgi:hypothetical protein
MMTDATLLEIVRQLPPDKVQELYDFACFLAQSCPDSESLSHSGVIEGFVSEDEMIDYINDIGKLVYAD